MNDAPERLKDSSSRSTLIVTALLAYGVLHLTALAIYRLYLSPIRKFPGPKLAALTKWYEFYYEVPLRGEFSNHVAELHKIYGPIVRITPTELHVNDPQFYEVLFNKNPKSEKDPWFNPRFGNHTSVFSTCNPAHHKVRRAPLNPYFSTRAIAGCEDIVQEKISYATDKVAAYKAQDRPFDLVRMWDAYSGDIIMQYSFGFSYDNLKSEDFVETFHEAFLALTEFGGLGCQFPWLAPIMEATPDWITRIMNPALDRVITFLNDLSSHVDKMKEDIKAGIKPSRPTIIHEILVSDLPAEEKGKRRMRDEAQTIVGAGLTTTAQSLTNCCYYIIENKAIQEKLHQELVDAIPDIHAPGAFNVKKLEGLPYLRGCIKEGVRLATPVTGRNNRIWRQLLPYKDWIIPAGTTVSMNAQDVHFNEDVFPQPREMIPERWAGFPKAKDGNPLEQYFVPFGKGDRQCLGINLAYAEMFIGLAHMFRKFRLQLYETDRSDVVMAHEFFIPAVKDDTKGVRVKIAEIYA